MTSLELKQLDVAEEDCDYAIGLNPSFQKPYQVRANVRKEMLDSGYVEDPEELLKKIKEGTLFI